MTGSKRCLSKDRLLIKKTLKTHTPYLAKNITYI